MFTKISVAAMGLLAAAGLVAAESHTVTWTVRVFLRLVFGVHLADDFWPE